MADYWPPACELEAITAEAIAACDALDGVEDNIISWGGSCNFDPFSVVGKSVSCSAFNKTTTISNEVARIAQAAWQGPIDENGEFLWYGLDYGADLTSLAGTSCTSLTNCSTSPFPISRDWFRYFLAKDPTFNITNLMLKDYTRFFRSSVNQYASVIGTGDPDLNSFKNAGGKMITWHGTADQLIPFNGTTDYYGRVLKHDPDAVDYYRFFPAPGLMHCHGGNGYYPGDAMEALIDWVENGAAPETLYAEVLSGDIPEIHGGPKSRALNLCRHPSRITYIGGDTALASSFACM